MSDFAKLTVEIDSRGVRRTRDEMGRFAKGAKKAETATKKLKDAWLAYGKVLLVGGAIFIGLRKILRLAGEQSETLAQLRAGLKSTAGVSGQTVESMQALSAEMQRTTAFANETVEAAEGILLSFTMIADDVFPRAIMASANIATRMGVDLKTALIQVAKALNDPIQNLSALSRSGIQFSAAQKTLIKELWNTNRAAEAQRIILGELDKQYGNSAVMAKETLGGAMAGLRNEWDDLLKAIGQGIAPALTPAFKFLSDTIISFQVDTNMLAEDLRENMDEQTRAFLIAEQTVKKLAEAEKARAVSAEKAAKVRAATRLDTIEKSLISEAVLKEQARRTEYERNELFLHQQIQQHAEGTTERLRLEDVYYQHMSKFYDEQPDKKKKSDDKIIESAMTLKSEMESLTLSWGTTFIDSLFDAESRAELTFESIASGFAKMVARMLAQQALLAALRLENIWTPRPTASGDAFSAGRVIPMAQGGVVTRPTLFPMARGAGLMGEAGPEAVMPLTRTSSGDLGVKAEGAGSEVTVNVINNTGAAVTQQRRQSGQRTEIDVIVGEAVDRRIREGDFDRSLQSSFGIRRRAGR